MTYKLGPRHKSREVSSRMPNWGWLLISHDSHALGTFPLNWTFPLLPFCPQPSPAQQAEAEDGEAGPHYMVRQRLSERQP